MSNEIVFGHANAFLASAKEGSAKPIGLYKSLFQELEGDWLKVDAHIMWPVVHKT